MSLGYLEKKIFPDVPDLPDLARSGQIWDVWENFFFQKKKKNFQIWPDLGGPDLEIWPDLAASVKKGTLTFRFFSVFISFFSVFLVQGEISLCEKKKKTKWTELHRIGPNS